MKFPARATAFTPASSEPLLPIATVEASTGIPKETLRAWERRYGFPLPLRDTAGERLYTAEQLRQLRDAKRLIDRGARPGQIFVDGALQVADATPLASEAERRFERFAEWLALIAQFRVDELSVSLQREMLSRGLPSFTSELLAPLIRAVGDAWHAGRLSVAAEHLFSARVTALLQATLISAPAGHGRPVVICATVSGERHGLGLLMAQAMLAGHGLRVIDLGVDLPPADIALAARETGADVVMLSFSAYFGYRQVPDLLDRLLMQLPKSVELWVGGAGARTARAGLRLRVTQSLNDIPLWIEGWQPARLSTDVI